MEDDYKAIVIGVSAGGISVIKALINRLPPMFFAPVVIVQHIGSNDNHNWIDLLNKNSKLKIKEADEKEVLEAGIVYLAPPNYHLLVEPDHTFTLTIDERVNYARPSIDVTFETAAEVYKKHLIGIILTGANSDGAYGLLCVKEKGGLTIVQHPATAEVNFMPKAAIQLAKPHYIFSLEEIITFLLSIDRKIKKEYHGNNKYAT